MNTTGSITVIVGFAAEARVARRLGLRVLVGGGTPAGAAAAAQAAVTSGATALISFGLAGGLDPALRPGAILVPDCILSGEDRLLTDLDLSRRLGGPTPHSVLGADSIAADPAGKQRLFARTGAAAVDLESGAVARVAAAHGLPFAALRAICDPAGRALPPAALLALDGQGAIAFGRVLRSVIAQPGQVPALFALALDAAAARHSLRRRVAAIRL